MLKFQIALIAILIACVAFVSCERAQQMLEPVTEDLTAPDDMTTADDTMKMIAMMDSTMYMSWAHVALPAPGPKEEATSPAETGGVHGLGTRVVYINDIGAMANKAGTAYPAGTMIVKVIMDDANTFVAKKSMMMKSDDPMYAGHNGWVYKKYARPSADAEYMQVKGSNLEDAGNGCHGCHAQAENDSVFVSLSMDGDDKKDADMDGIDGEKIDMDGEKTDMGDMDGEKETDMDTTPPEAAATSEPSDGHGDDHGDTGAGATGNGAGNGDTNGDDTEAASIANDDVQ